MPGILFGKCVVALGLNVQIPYYNASREFEKVVWINFDARSKAAQAELRKILPAVILKHQSGKPLQDAIEKTIKDNKKLIRDNSTTYYEWNPKKDTGKTWKKGEAKPTVPPLPRQ
jgi:hypothetical protein